MQGVGAGSTHNRCGCLLHARGAPCVRCAEESAEGARNGVKALYRHVTRRARGDSQPPPHQKRSPHTQSEAAPSTRPG